MSLKLYEIADEYRSLLSLLEDSDDDDVDSESFLLALDALESDFTAKATNTGCLIREISAEASAINETVKGLQQRAKRLEKRADMLRDYLHIQMQASGIHSAADARISVSLRKNPPSVRIDTGEAIPALYCRVIPARTEPDKAAIKEALKEGVAVPGATLVQTTRLDIK